MIKANDGAIVYEVSPGAYTTTYALVSEVVTLESDSEYIFTITDTAGDGLYGHVTLYLGDIADANKILGNYDYSYSRYFGSSYDIIFLAEEEGILANIIPSTTPTISQLPTLIPSNIPSMEPTSPTASPAPTKKQTNILVEIQLDYYAYQTGWMIKDNDGIIIYEVSPGTYTKIYSYALVSEVVTLDYESEYTFMITDTAGDGLYGRVTLYLGDIADDNKVLGNYDYNYNDFYEQYFRSYDIEFLAEEEGILANIIPSTTPTMSLLPTLIPSNFPSMEPTSPTASPAPTKEQTNILVEIELDNFPYETGWMIKDNDGNIIYEVSPGTYTTTYALVSEVVTLEYDSEYTFTVTDTYGDGLSGRVTLYLGDIADDNKILGSYGYIVGFNFGYSYNFNFRAGEEGIPTTTPTISQLPTLIPSKIPSMEPTSPTASPAPTNEPTNILVEIQLDYFGYQTGWMIKDNDGDITYEVSSGTYTATTYALVSEVVTLEYDSEYTFTITDTAGDGLYGRVTLYLGDIADDNKVLGNYDSNYNDFYEQYFRSYDINFRAGEEGILANIIPSTTPTISQLPTLNPSKIPSMEPTSPTASPAPTNEPTNILVEIQLDYFGYQTGWMIKDNDGDVVYEVSPGTYTAIYYALVSEVVTLEYDSEYTFTITDTYGNGLYGRVTLYLGDIADDNKVLGNYDFNHDFYYFYSYNITFRSGLEGTPTPTVNPTEPMTSSPSFIPPVAPTPLRTPNPMAQITPDHTEENPFNAQSGKKGGKKKTKKAPKSKKQKKN